MELWVKSLSISVLLDLRFVILIAAPKNGRKGRKKGTKSKIKSNNTDKMEFA